MDWPRTQAALQRLQRARQAEKTAIQKASRPAKGKKPQ